MSVNIRDRGLRDGAVDPQAPSQRARGLDTGARDPETTSGTPVRVTTGTGATRVLGTAGSTSVSTGTTRQTGVVDGAERISTRTEDPELRAIFDNPPPLPSSGAHVLRRAERDALDDFLERTHDGDAALMWEAMTEMARTSQTDMDLAKRLKNARPEFKDETQVTITANPGIDYKTVIDVMDALRSDGEEELFPEVHFGVAR